VKCLWPAPYSWCGLSNIASWLQLWMCIAPLGQPNLSKLHIACALRAKRPASGTQIAKLRQEGVTLVN